MSVRTQSSVEFEKITYMALPDGNADVWLHKNIEQVTDDEGNEMWEADEVYLRTALTKSEVSSSFSKIFKDPESYALVVQTEEEAEASAIEALTARVEELEALTARVATLEASVTAIEEKTVSADTVIEAVPAE